MAEATQPTPAQIEEIHAKTTEISDRLKQDTAFRSEFQTDPMGTLTKAGLPEDAAKELLTRVAKASGKDEVSGYDYYIDTYVYYNGYYAVERDWYDNYGDFLYSEVVSGHE